MQNHGYNFLPEYVYMRIYRLYCGAQFGFSELAGAHYGFLKMSDCNEARRAEGLYE